MEYEDRLTISTPEGVELELTLAGIGSRFTASVIDHTVQFSLVFALTIALGIGLDSLETSGGGVQAQDAGTSALGYAILTLAGFLVFVGYDVLFEVRAGGRTPGKRLTGLRVVRASGRPVGFLASAIRNVLRVVDILPPFYGLAMTVIFASSRNQRLGDIAAGTVVVRERKGGRTRREPAAAAAAAAAPVAPAAGETAAWDVSAIAADELATVRRFLERRDALPDEPRAQLAADLARRLRPKVAGAPEHLAPESFLEGLSAAKAARTV